ncbi:OLC1v1036449C1 [Oldenlandia corymbosa var. corymbosa]|uniref:OLC1v1036449C1 n=1 Tax=Oldenlandia corymbosa var. corymbosa TaxID=529605 RepID=A0AAV1CW74_OLDCO|nr:OLC1v1036449C1 [Oldenlandia corymbosa var. corymbosa]
MEPRHNPRTPVKLPKGFRFSPKDWELIKYLECKVFSKPLPCDHVIRDNVDVYDSDYHPKTLIDRHGDDENVVYVFTNRKKVAEKGKNYGRSAGEYTWKANNRGTPVEKEDGLGEKVKVGWVKTLCLVNRMEERTGYIMKEFTLPKSDLENASDEFKHYALCRIYKKPKKDKAKAKKNKSKEDLKQEAVDDVPSLISFETPPDHQNAVNNDIHAALQYEDPIEFSFADSIVPPQLDQIFDHNTQQQDDTFDEKFSWLMNALEQYNDPHDLLSTQQDPFLPGWYDHHQLLVTQGFSESCSSSQNQMYPLTAFLPNYQQTLIDCQEEPNQEKLQASKMGSIDFDIMKPSTSRVTLKRLRELNRDNKDLGTLPEIDRQIPKVPKMMTKKSRTHSQVLANTNQEEMCDNNRGVCSKFGWELAKMLASSNQGNSIPNEDPMIDNELGLERLRDFMMPS